MTSSLPLDLLASMRTALDVRALLDILVTKEIDVVPCDRETGTPLTPNGIGDASSVPSIIAGWWDQWPDAGFCIPFGRLSGLRAFEAAHWRFADGGEQRWKKRYMKSAKAAGLQVDIMPIPTKSPRHSDLMAPGIPT